MGYQNRLKTIAQQHPYEQKKVILAKKASTRRPRYTFFRLQEQVRHPLKSPKIQAHLGKMLE